MKCQVCRERKSAVIETRRLDRTIWRRRCCSGCSTIFVTQETYAEKLPEKIHLLSHGNGVKALRIIKPKVAA